MNILKGNVRQGKTTLSRLKPQAKHLRAIGTLGTVDDASVRRQCVGLIKTLLSLRTKTGAVLT